MNNGILILVLLISCSVIAGILNPQPITASSIIGHQWTNGISMPRSIFEVSATVLNEKIYVAGGQAD